MINCPIKSSTIRHVTVVTVTPSADPSLMFDAEEAENWEVVFEMYR